MNKTEYLTKRISGLRAVVAVLLAIIMAASVVLGVGFGVYGKNTDDWFKPKQDSNQEQQDPEQPGQPSEGEQVESTARVMLMSGATVASENGSVSKTLTAVVLPDDAPNKAVDWTIKWSDDAPLKGKNISEYITVTPASDGALTATVTAHKSFRGSTAGITVTTREGQYTASTAVTYDGIPSSLSLNTTGFSKNSGVNGFQYIVPVKGTSSIAVSLSNVFGDVGEDFYKNIKLEVKGVGEIIVQDYRSAAGNSSWLGNESTLTLDSIKDSIFSTSYDTTSKSLKISPKKTVESYYKSVTGGPSGAVTYGKFKSYKANSAGSAGVTPYFKILVRYGDATDGVIAEFMFSIVSTVNSVALSETVITF